MASIMSPNMPRKKLSDEIWTTVDSIDRRRNKLRKIIFHDDEFNIAPSQTLELNSYKRKLEKFLNMTDCKERNFEFQSLL